MSISTITPAANEPGDLPSPHIDQAPSDALTSGDRSERIRRAAYGRYEQRGFEGGHEEEDWLAAEAEIDGVSAVQIDQKP